MDKIEGFGLITPNDSPEAAELRYLQELEKKDLLDDNGYKRLDALEEALGLKMGEEI